MARCHPPDDDGVSHHYNTQILVDRSGEVGEHYIAASKSEYRQIWIAAAGGGILTAFTAAMKGSTTYLARLIRETYIVGGFRDWIPGGQQELVVDQQTVADPVVPTRLYVGTPDTQYAMFWIGSPARKSIVFELSSSTTGSGWDIARIFLAEKSTLGGKTRIVDWTSDINRDFVPAADDFVFVPPTDARPVVGPRPNIDVLMPGTRVAARRGALLVIGWLYSFPLLALLLQIFGSPQRIFVLSSSVGWADYVFHYPVWIVLFLVLELAPVFGVVDLVGLVWRRFPASNGEILTRRCTPASAFR